MKSKVQSDYNGSLGGGTFDSVGAGLLVPDVVLKAPLSVEYYWSSGSMVADSTGKVLRSLRFGNTVGGSLNVLGLGWLNVDAAILLHVGNSVDVGLSL